jgi:hypothetical protein
VSLSQVLQEQGCRLASIWTPALEQVRLEISCQDGHLFSGLVAFAGIQMQLWPFWIKRCEEAGLAKELRETTFSWQMARYSESPWICLVAAFGEQAALMHLQAPGLCQNRKLLDEIRKPSFLQFMRTLDEEGHVLAYNKGIEILYSLGHTYANNEPLRVPMIKWSTLLSQWPAWQKSATEITEEMNDIIDAWLQKRADNETAIMAFQQLAAGLWQALQDKGVLQCGQSKKSFFSFLKPQKSEETFLGNIVFYGDHQAFWDQIKAEAGNGVRA